MRNYQRKTERKLCTEAMLKTARENIKNGMSIRKAAVELGITEGGLRKRLKSGVGAVKLGRFNPIFTELQEKELAAHITNLDDHFYGLSWKDLRRLAFDYAESNNIPNRFDRNTKLAGKDWAVAFMQKYKLSMRTPSKTSLARIMGFNKVQVERFFNNLETVMAKHSFPPSRIFNMDESGISTVPNKTPRVVSLKGKKLVGKVVSAERGKLSTIICAASATGNYVPPVIIFPRKREKQELMNGAPPDSVMMCSDSGYSNSDLFLQWLKHFQKHVFATEDNPVLLVLDNHASHISLEGILYSRQHHIHMLTIPPHSSHKIQPLDRCFFKPLKDYFSQTCDQWLLNNPGRVVGQFQIAEIFGKAYEKAATMGKGIVGFKKCGIYPFDRNVFSEEDFLPSGVTDQQEIPEQTSDTGHQQKENVEEIATEEPAVEHDVQIISTPKSSKSDERAWVSPSDIKPLPKRKLPQMRQTKKQKSQVLTGSPFKNKLEEEKNEKDLKEEIMRLKKKLALVQKTANSVKLESGNKEKKVFSRQTKTIKKEKDEKVKTKQRPPSSSNEKITVKKENAKTKQTPSSSSSDKVMCPGCDEEYKDPPEEDWIECCRCHEWWHEACSSYEGLGHFTCDYC